MTEYTGKRGVLGSKPRALSAYGESSSSYVNPENIPLPYGFRKKRDSIDLIYEIFCRYPYVTLGRIQNYLKVDIEDAVKELRKRGYKIEKSIGKRGKTRYSLVKDD